MTPPRLLPERLRPLRSMHILVVEDDRFAREQLSLLLSRFADRLTTAADGAQGLETYKFERPDIVVTDINMPRLDGFGFIEGVRRNEKYRAIPILVLTTESDAEKKNRARQAGATGWIVKPFDPTKLIDAIERVTA